MASRDPLRDGGVNFFCARLVAEMTPYERFLPAR